jgi:hypothetical protein
MTAYLFQVRFQECNGRPDAGSTAASQIFETKEEADKRAQELYNEGHKNVFVKWIDK